MNPRLRELYDGEFRISRIGAREDARARKLRRRRERLYPLIWAMAIGIFIYLALWVSQG